MSPPAKKVAKTSVAASAGAVEAKGLHNNKNNLASAAPQTVKPVAAAPAIAKAASSPAAATPASKTPEKDIVHLAHAHPQKRKWWQFGRARTAEESARLAEAEQQRVLIAKDVKHTKVETAPVKDVGEPLLKGRKKPVRKRRPLKLLFKLAGLPDEPTIIFRKLIGVAFWITFALTLFAVFMGVFYGEAFKDAIAIKEFLGFAVSLWTVGFAGIYCLSLIAYMVWVDLLIQKRRKEIETVFPDYLQLAAANLSAGMTIDRALWSAVRPRFGVLAHEMEDVAKKTMTGYDLERSLKEFSEKYDSIVIKRAVDLICEGTRSGGRMADILTKISINMQENAILQKEMAANVTTYVIFISFASVLASPFLFALSTQLLIVIQGIAGSIAMDAGSSQGVGLSLSADAIKLSDFRIFAFAALTVTSVMSACIVSVIRKGTVFDGLRTAPAYWVITMSLYLFATWALSFLFGGFLAVG